MSELKTIYKTKEEMDEIKNIAEEIDVTKIKERFFNTITFEFNFSDVLKRNQLIHPEITQPIHNKRKLKRAKRKEEREIENISESIKSLKKQTLNLEKKIDEFFLVIEKRLRRIEEMIYDEDDSDVIEIKDYTYDEARKIIEDYLIEEDREVEPFEIITKFGIDLHLVQEIFTDLVYEGKAE